MAIGPKTPTPSTRDLSRLWAKGPANYKTEKTLLKTLLKDLIKRPY